MRVNLTRDYWTNKLNDGVRFYREARLKQWEKRRLADEELVAQTVNAVSGIASWVKRDHGGKEVEDTIGNLFKESK